jgi:nicotinate (nicotinamide) nucleotide adenylyltransferase
MIYIFWAAFDPPHVGHSAIIRALLHYKNPEKIIVMPSGKRDDKSYRTTDENRLAMLRVFVSEIADERVIIDAYFIENWEGEMITRDVDEYCKKTYGDDIIHVFGTDTIEGMSGWDEEWYAAKVIRKLFVPRGSWTQDISTENLDNFGFFTDSHIPDISSTEIRASIPEHTGLKELFEENPKFIIKWLSNKISRYILENRLYRPRLEKKPKILVHVCCGPDVTMPILQLRDEYDVICFWYDPNIQPKAEYDRRYEAFVKICEIENIPYIKGAYDVGNFFSRIKWVEHTPERGEKCTYCYDMRMMVSAKLAKRLKIPYYTSSLNTSPKKDLEKLFKMGHLYGEKYGVEFLDIPFRKRWGFEKSVEYTREHDIYRQNYCGCIYSIREGGDSDMKKRMVW